MEIVPFITRKQSASNAASRAGASDFDDEDEDWGWNDAQSSQARSSAGSSSQSDDIQRLETKAIVETYVDRLLQPLKVWLVHSVWRSLKMTRGEFSLTVLSMLLQECSQLFAKMNDEEYSSTEVETPRSLVAQLCSFILNPTRSHIPELEHVSAERRLIWLVGNSIFTNVTWFVDCGRLGTTDTSWYRFAQKWLQSIRLWSRCG